MMPCLQSELQSKNFGLHPRSPAHFVCDPLESGKTNFLDSFIGWFTI